MIVHEVGGTLILTGDSLELLKAMPDRSVQCCVTSPPYWGLRDYGCAGQLGLESTPEEYVAKMVAVFREVRRVLRDDGTLWLNLGDSYGATGGNTYAGFNERWNGTGGAGSKQDETLHGVTGRKIETRLRTKNLIGTPWRVAFALQADGWYLRQDIIWAKPNPMPESVRDRCTKSHEYIFLCTKSERYYFDAEAIKEPAVTTGKPIKMADGWDTGEGGHGTIHRAGREKGASNGALQSSHRNRRSVWTVTTKPFKGAHFATFPPDLIEPCILAGSSAKGACPHCGAGWKRVVEKGAPDLEHQIACGGDANGEYDGQATKDYAAAGAQDASATKARILAGMVAKVTTGWVPTCKCPPHEPVPQVVLDPFGGSGTVGMVSERHGRRAVLMELSPDYVAIAKARCEHAQIAANRLAGPSRAQLDTTQLKAA